jgi:hypothetical protein
MRLIDALALFTCWLLGWQLLSYYTDGLYLVDTGKAIESRTVAGMLLSAIV